jgi:hypothetical protein
VAEVLFDSLDARNGGGTPVFSVHSPNKIAPKRFGQHQSLKAWKNEIFSNPSFSDEVPVNRVPRTDLQHLQSSAQTDPQIHASPVSGCGPGRLGGHHHRRLIWVRAATDPEGCAKTIALKTPALGSKWDKITPSAIAVVPAADSRS